MNARRLMLVMVAAIAAGWAGRAAGADGSQAVELVPGNPAAVAAREQAIAAKAPEGAKLAAYLDCGCQRESGGVGPVKIVCVSAKPYRFPVEGADVPPTQATVFFDAEQVVFEIRGLDGARNYLAGMTWWDYDNGQRTQCVLVSSPDQRLVRLAVPAIRLPDYKDSGLLPAERRFQLPVTFSQDGKLRLVVQRVDGANAVISELWVWQMAAP
ncbi:MAG: hypothetical protein N2439_10825 [Anaerolineae bacterium]|nr:hypothetical protein [Anaerolineae bacterium]